MKFRASPFKKYILDTGQDPKRNDLCLKTIDEEEKVIERRELNSFASVAFDNDVERIKTVQIESSSTNEVVYRQAFDKDKKTTYKDGHYFFTFDEHLVRMKVTVLIDCSRYNLTKNGKFDLF